MKRPSKFPSLSVRLIDRFDPCSEGREDFLRVFGKKSIAVTAANVRKGQQNGLSLSFLLNALDIQREPISTTAKCNCDYCQKYRARRITISQYADSKEIAAALRKALKVRRAGQK